MEEFRNRSLTGEWWDTEVPDARYRGVLLLEDTNHGKLTLRATEEEFASLRSGPFPRTFHGVMQNSYNYSVTLFDAYMSEGPAHTFPKMPANQTEAIFRTNSIVIGEHIESQDKKFLNGGILQLTGLNDWCDATGFKGKLDRPALWEAGTETVKLEFEGSVTNHFNLGDGRLFRLFSEYRGPRSFEGRKSVTLNEINSVELVFSYAISIKELLTEITIWQSFFTLGLRRASHIDEITILVSQGGEHFSRVALLVPGRKRDGAWKQIPDREILFNQSKLGAKLETYVQAWRERQRDIELAVLLYSSTAFKDGTYNHTVLLTYLQALEILHRETFKIDRFPSDKARREVISSLRKAIPPTVEEPLRSDIESQLGYIGTLTLLDRLKHLFSLYPKSCSPLFLGGDSDMRMLKEIRNFLTHYGDQKKFDKDFLVVCGTARVERENETIS